MSPSSADPSAPWVSLGTPAEELRLEFTLLTGQSFRWVQTGEGRYTGVIGQRVVEMRQHDSDVSYRVLARGPAAPPEGDAAAIADYFNLGTSLAALRAQWSKADDRFAAVTPYLPGARMLRQDPVECLFQFICSSNNHISRIHGMVDKMCGWYGTPLLLGGSAPAPGQAVARGASGPGAAVQSVGIKLEDGADASVDATVTAVAAATPLARGKAAAGKSAVKTEASPSTPGGAAAKPGVKSPASSAEGWYAFPTLQQLSAATEQQLRDGGFGYRAKYITGTAAQLLAKPGGGEAWLMALRAKPCEEAVEALCELPGIGPKVAACVALFSLDKHDAIPVDTHVWQIAVRYYLPKLAGKALTKNLHASVAAAFTDRFGAYAGWAHNTLFISELASHRHLLPEHLRAPTPASGRKGGKACLKPTAGAVDSDEEDSASTSSSGRDSDGDRAAAKSGSKRAAKDRSGGATPASASASTKRRLSVGSAGGDSGKGGGSSAKRAAKSTGTRGVEAVGAPAAKARKDATPQTARKAKAAYSDLFGGLDD